MCKLFGHGFFPLWLAPSLAVGTSIVVMQITKTLHPPGATALIATIGSEKVKALGYAYVLSPVFTGLLLMFVVALAVNNLHKDRHTRRNGFDGTVMNDLKIFRNLKYCTIPARMG